MKTHTPLLMYPRIPSEDRSSVARHQTGNRTHTHTTSPFLISLDGNPKRKKGHI